MPDDTEKPDDLAIDPIDWFSIRGGWLHLPNRDRLKLRSLRKYAYSDYDIFLTFDNGDTYNIDSYIDGRKPLPLIKALDDFFFENIWINKKTPEQPS